MNATPRPAAEIDDYVFEPCGYSMNGVEQGTFSTIHITPEDGEAVYNGLKWQEAGQGSEVAG